MNDSQLSLDFHAQARDRALNLLEEKKSRLVSIAKAFALEIANKKGTVTGPEVMKMMRERMPDDKELNNSDPRFMGAVFRSGNGWVRAGFSQTGSHKQLISIWRRK